jgi:uncharacterized membrane protein HdeD (DUF308 family)
VTAGEKIFEGAPNTLLQSTGRRAGWPMILRGVIAVIFGIIALRRPGATAGAFVAVFAIFAIVDGLLDFVVAGALGRTGRRWGWYVFEGIASIALGIVALAYPHVTLLALVLLVGIRAVILGVLELGSAFAWKELDSRWLLGITGVMSIIFGIVLFASPIAGGIALVWTIGVYAIIFGMMLFALGVRFAAGQPRRAAV